MIALYDREIQQFQRLYDGVVRYPYTGQRITLCKTQVNFTIRVLSVIDINDLRDNARPRYFLQQ